MESAVYTINYFGGRADITLLENCTHGQAGYMAYSEDVFRWMLEQ